MAITDYSSLKTSVANWIHRSDLTALIPDFITLAEAMMNGDLNSRGQEARTTLTASTSTNLIALPTDMIEMRRLQITSTTPYRVLNYKTPEQLSVDFPYQPGTQEPDSFTVVGGNIELNCTPDSAYSLECIYRQKLPALSDSQTTNWLLTAYPMAYLFGTLLAAMPYTRDEEHLDIYKQYYQDQIDTINSIDWYSGSGMRVRAK